MTWLEWFHEVSGIQQWRRGIIIQAIASKKNRRWISFDRSIEFLDGVRETAVYRPSPDSRDGEYEIDLALTKCMNCDWKPREIWRITGT